MRLIGTVQGEFAGLALKFKQRFIDGMPKGQTAGMQAQPGKGQAAAADIANDRMPDRLAVYSQLIRTSCNRFQLEQCRAVISLADRVSRNRDLAVRFHTPYLVFGISAYWDLDHTFVCRNYAVDKRQISFLDPFVQKFR